MEKEVDDTRLPRKEEKSFKNSWRVYFDSLLPSGRMFLSCLYHVYIDLETSTIQIRIGGKFLPP